VSAHHSISAVIAKLKGYTEPSLLHDDDLTEEIETHVGGVSINNPINNGYRYHV
jgi:hypothetical protein